MTNRRDFLKHSLIAGGAAALPGLSGCAIGSRPVGHVVVVGGGFGGATVAKYLRMWSDKGVAVTLVERNPRFISCPISNLVIGGDKTLADITLGYDGLRNTWGVTVLQDEALAIDPAGRTLRLASGGTLRYDRLVLSPGVDFQFDQVPGLESEAAQGAILHAWKAGAQTVALRKQLEDMKDGGVYALTIPKAPYRCPPGPYERACLLADSLLRRRRAGRVIVLDANSDVVAEPHTFHTAFQTTYAGVIDYRPSSEVLSVDWAGKKIVTNWESVPFDAANIIPPQRAGKLVAAAGLLGSDPATRWAPVNPLSYESRVVPNVHVIGDSQGTGQPKSGHMANAQAKVCADALVRYFAGEQPDPAPMTSSACYSPITATTASWLTVVFGYDPATGLMKPVANTLAEAPAPTAGHYKDMFGWAKNLFADSFS